MSILILTGVYSIFLSIIIILSKGTIKKRDAILNLVIATIGVIADSVVLISGLYSKEVEIYTILFGVGIAMFILAIVRLFNKNEILEIELLPNTYSIELKHSIERVLHYLIVDNKKILLSQNITDTNLKLRVYYMNTKNGYVASKVKILDGKSLFYRFVEISSIIALLLTPLIFYYEYSIGYIPMDSTDDGTPLCILFFLYALFAFGKLSFFTKIKKKDALYTFIWWIMNMLYFMMLFLVIFYSISCII